MRQFRKHRKSSTQLEWREIILGIWVRQTEKNLTPRLFDGGCEVVRTVKKKKKPKTRVQKQDSEWWGD